MKRTLISNIKQLIQTEQGNENKLRILGLEMKHLPFIENAYLIIEDDLIKDFGSMTELHQHQQFDATIDATHQFVLPCWVDSHTHLVHAASREAEFVDKINGLSYEEIAQRGGGILNSAKKINEISEEELVDISLVRLHDVMKLGTGSIEIKSGYGLSIEGELKMLRVIQKLKQQVPIIIKTSFLAAHTYPLQFKNNHQGYLDLIINEMLPIVAHNGLADYMDVFCEQGFFSVAETDTLLEAAATYNLKPKIHANQLYKSGGVQVGVKHGAVSVDHLESMGEEEMMCLQNSTTIPTLLPGAAFFLAMHYQPARTMIDANLPIALASDFNPGSCPSGNMNFILSLACTQLKMTPEEAIHACTINGAAAIEISDKVGTIKIGKKANLIITKTIPSLAYMPYAFATNLIDKVIINGAII